MELSKNRISHSLHLLFWASEVQEMMRIEDIDSFFFFFFCPVVLDTYLILTFLVLD